MTIRGIRPDVTEDPTEGAQEEANAQTDWFIDAVSGNDRAIGSLAAPLRSLGEWRKRIGDGPIVVNMVVTPLTDVVEALDLPGIRFGTNLVQPFLPFVLPGTLLVQGTTPTVLHQGTFT